MSLNEKKFGILRDLCMMLHTHTAIHTNGIFVCHEIILAYCLDLKIGNHSLNRMMRGDGFCTFKLKDTNKF